MTINQTGGKAMKISELATGSIVWKGKIVLGIKGITLPERFNDYDCINLEDNDFDYEIVFNGTLKKLMETSDEH